MEIIQTSVIGGNHNEKTKSLKEKIISLILILILCITSASNANVIYVNASEQSDNTSNGEYYLQNGVLSIKKLIIKDGKLERDWPDLKGNIKKLRIVNPQISISGDREELDLSMLFLCSGIKELEIKGLDIDGFKRINLYCFISHNSNLEKVSIDWDFHDAQ